jgi:hypothetical protein
MAKKISQLTAVLAVNLDDTALLEVSDKNKASRNATVLQLRTAVAAGAIAFLSTVAMAGTLTLGSAGVAYTAQGTATAGIDQAAGAVTITGNLSTGAGTPGSIVLQGGQVLGTGATVQTAAAIATFRQGTTTAVSEWVHGQATARIIGGATNGLAIRDSANTRDNLLITDAGTGMTLNNGTKTAVLQAITAAQGEVPGGGQLRGSDATSAFIITGGNATIGGTIGLAYGDNTIFRSAVEVTNVAAGFGTLDLMKSGGIVRVHGNAGTTANALTIDGGAYGAGVASIRYNGLTTAATNNLVGTLTNSPVTGNPTFWMPVSIAGVIKYSPLW